MRRNVEKVKHTREGTIARLRGLGFEVPDSAANFVYSRAWPRHDLEPLRACDSRTRHPGALLPPPRCCATHSGFDWHPRRNEHTIQKPNLAANLSMLNLDGTVTPREDADERSRYLRRLPHTPKERARSPPASNAPPETRSIVVAASAIPARNVRARGVTPGSGASRRSPNPGGARDSIAKSSKACLPNSLAGDRAVLVNPQTCYDGSDNVCAAVLGTIEVPGPSRLISSSTIELESGSRPATPRAGR